MAFTVEDNTGLSDANSYTTLAYANDYWTDRGGWTGTDAAKEAALIRATDYIEQVYGTKWSGTKFLSTQALSWPRYNSEETKFDVPTQVKQATAILAKEALVGDLNPVLGRATRMEKVDVIEVEYMDNAAPMPQRPAIDGLLLNTGWLNSTAAWGIPFNGTVERR